MKTKATIDSFIQNYDALKQKGRVITNSFVGLVELEKIFIRKPSFICAFENSLFVLMTEYTHYEIFYYSLGLDDLAKDFKALKSELPNDSFKIKLITRKEEIENKMTQFFEENGFEKKGRIVRLVSNKKGIENHLEILDDLIKATPEKYRHVGFAQESEAQAIKELLLTEFDPVIDSTPDIEEIKENIAKNQIIVVRNDECDILSLRYFTVERGICSLIYEVTHKDYRKLGLIYQILYFFTVNNKRNGIEFAKVLAWRNAVKNNLLKFSKSMNEVPDGTIVSVFFYNKNAME